MVSSGGSGVKLYLKSTFLTGDIIGIIGRIGLEANFGAGPWTGKIGRIEFLACELADDGRTGLAKAGLVINIRIPTNSSVAQSVEQAAVNRWVVGSSPTRGALLKSRRILDLGYLPAVGSAAL